MKNAPGFPVIYVLFFTLQTIPYSDSVRGCTVMLQSDTSNFKIAICNDPSTFLKKVPKDIPISTIRLEMMYQSLASLASNEFSHIYQLEYLTLNSCGIRYISPTTFENLNQLRVLALSNNSLVIHDNSNLQAEIFQPLISLSVLDLSHNFIQMIPKHFFRYLDKTLRILVISNSKSLLTISPESLSDLIRLERLDISQNNLLQLDSGFEAIFNKMISFQNLILHGNPWKCDCRMRWLVFWYQHSTLSNYPLESLSGASHSHHPPAVCHSPRSMRNALLLRPISSPIKNDEFPCFPKCLSKNGKFHIYEGSNTSIPCNFQSSNQNLKINWSHNGSDIKETSNVFVSQINDKPHQSTLSIVNFTYQNSGQWCCYILFDGNTIGANFSLFLKLKVKEKQFYVKKTLNMNTTKTITLTLLGSVTLLFLLSLFMGLVYRYFHHFTPRSGIVINQKYSTKSNDILRERHNMIYNRLQENLKCNGESFEFWNLRSSEMEDDKTYLNATVLRNPQILTSLSDDAFIVPCMGNDDSRPDSHIFVNPYIEASATLITRTPGSTPCPIHKPIGSSLESSKHDSLTSSIYQPCPLHGDLLSVLLQSSTSSS